MEFIISISFIKSGLAYKFRAGTKPDSIVGAAKGINGTDYTVISGYTGVDLVGTNEGVAKLKSVLTSIYEKLFAMVG